MEDALWFVLVFIDLAALMEPLLLFLPFHQWATMMYSLAQMSPEINVLLLTLIDSSREILPLF